MSLWRLEWLRLVRTHRLLVLLAVYLFFGAVGPFTARYLQLLITRFGEGVRVEMPPPQPADGIAQFVSNASQVGVVVTVLLAAATLAFDGQRENAVFLRTRVRHVRDLVLVKYVATAAAVWLAFALGSALAWYETAILIGAPPPAGMLVGIGLVLLYLAFAIAVVALVATVTVSSLATGLASLAVLLALGVVGSAIPPVARWLPSQLVGAMPSLAAHGEPSSYGWAALSALALTAAALLLAVRRSGRREL
jgi:ABC-2 type transport system permease protein